MKIRKLIIFIFATTSSVTIFAAGSPPSSDPSTFDITKWVFAIVGAITGFVPTFIGAVFKVRSVRAEILAKRIDLIEKADKAGNSLIQAYSEARECMKKIMKCWKDDDIEGLIENRELLSKTICDRVIPRLVHTAELTIQRWQDSPDRQMEFLSTEVRPSISELKGWIDDVINHQNLISETGKEPLKIKRSTVVRFNDIALECNKKVRKTAVTTMEGYINELAN